MAVYNKAVYVVLFDLHNVSHLVLLVFHSPALVPLGCLRLNYRLAPGYSDVSFRELAHTGFRRPVPGPTQGKEHNQAVYNKKMHFRGPVFDTKNLGIFDIFLTYFGPIDPSRPFFRAIFVILTHLRGIFCVLNEISSKKQRKIVTISTKKGALKGPQKMAFLIVHRHVYYAI